MDWKIIFLLYALTLAHGLEAADASVAEPKGMSSGDKTGSKNKKKRPIEKLDLNQVDLEQVEEDWDSTPSKPPVEVSNSVKIREIIEPSGEYSYASFGRPDPFLQPELNMGAAPIDPAQSMPMGKEIPIVSILQGYPLSDLNIKGVWQLSSGETRAVVLTPKNEGVVVKEGDPISSGKVLNIRRDRLMVRLYRLRSDGVREYQDVPMIIGGPDRNDRGVIKLEPGKDPVFVSPETEKAKPVPLSQALGGPTPIAGSAAVLQGQAQAGGKDAKPGAPAPVGAVAPINTGVLPIKNSLDGAALPPR